MYLCSLFFCFMRENMKIQPVETGLGAATKTKKKAPEKTEKTTEQRNEKWFRDVGGFSGLITDQAATGQQSRSEPANGRARILMLRSCLSCCVLCPSVLWIECSISATNQQLRDEWVYTDGKCLQKYET